MERRVYETADYLAKEGGESGINIVIEAPFLETKSHIVRKCNELWETNWNEYKGGRMVKSFMLQPDRKKTFHLLKLSSYKLGSMIRLTSGHNNLGVECSS